jgi:hypothetical protein
MPGGLARTCCSTACSLACSLAYYCSAACDSSPPINTVPHRCKCGCAAARNGSPMRPLSVGPKMRLKMYIGGQGPIVCKYDLSD